MPVDVPPTTEVPFSADSYAVSCHFWEQFINKKGVVSLGDLTCSAPFFTDVTKNFQAD